MDVNYRRLGRLIYLTLFMAIQYGTELFGNYPALFWLGVAGLVIVFFDAVICARRRWRVLRAEMRGEESDDRDPTC